MRFKRGDVPEMLIATLGPVAMMFLILASYTLWQTEGTPLLAIISTNLAIGAGLLAAFSRFIRHWDVVLGFLFFLALDVVAVVVLQRTGNDHTMWATVFKLLGVLLFLCLNAVALLDIVSEGLLPILDRRDQRRAARHAAEQ